MQELITAILLSCNFCTSICSTFTTLMSSISKHITYNLKDLRFFTAVRARQLKTVQFNILLMTPILSVVTE